MWLHIGHSSFNFMSLILVADVFLWKNKKVSGMVFGGATAIWLLFEVMEYYFLTLVCHGLIVLLVIMFLWSNATAFINK